MQRHQAFLVYMESMRNLQMRRFYLQIFLEKAIMKNVQKLFIDKFLMKQKKISENTKPKKTVFGFRV